MLSGLLPWIGLLALFRGPVAYIHLTFRKISQAGIPASVQNPLWGVQGRNTIGLPSDLPNLIGLYVRMGFCSAVWPGDGDCSLVGGPKPKV